MPKAKAQKLTKRFLEGLVCPPGKKEIAVQCVDPRGFGARIAATGRVSLFLKYRVGNQTRRLALGEFPATGVEEARTRAKAELERVRQGADPSAERKAERKAETVAELCDEYLRRHATPRKKARSIAEDRRMIELFIKPKLGRRKVAEVQRRDIARLHSEMHATPVQANRVASLLGKIFECAIVWGYRADNPARRIEKYRERSRERFLSLEEIGRLGVALRDVEAKIKADPRAEGNEWPTVPSLFRLLLLSGMRRGEALSLQWSDVDLDRRTVRLRDAKAGPRTVLLSAQAVEALRNVPRRAGLDGKDEAHVFWGRIAGKPLSDAKGPWQRIRVAADLPDVRIHDLRHAAGSLAAGAGFSLPVIGRMLGHKSTIATQVYAHVAIDPARAAVDEVGRLVRAAFAAADAKADAAPLPANVVSIKR